MIVLIPDSIHIHSRNFKSLCSFLDNNSKKLIKVGEHDNIKSLYGDYSSQSDLLSEYIDKIRNLSVVELLSFKHKGFNVFDIAKTEMLSFLMSKENWYKSKISSDRDFIINKSFNEDKDVLLGNMAATMFWLGFWKKRLGFAQYRTADICIMFSGSLIYTKALCMLLQNTKIRNFVVESFFTGDNHYLEEKYTGIANNSDIKYSNCYNRDRDEFYLKFKSHPGLDAVMTSSLNLLDNINNKNVTQPEPGSLVRFKTQSKTILLIAQVVNDFSILDNNLPFINSISIYKEIIDAILIHTDFNLIIKTHPWEKKKINLRDSVTFNQLNEHLGEYNADEMDRVRLVEDHNIYNLFNISDLVAGICSQSLIEATKYGHKVHQFGDSFFKERGFTVDYDNSDDFILAIKNGLSFTNLSIAEWGNFKEFLAVILNISLMSANGSSANDFSNRMRFSVNQPPIKNMVTNKDNYLYRLLLSDKKYRKWQHNHKAFYMDSPLGFLFK